MGVKNSNWITPGVQPTDGMVLTFDTAAGEARMKSLPLSVTITAAFTQPAVGGSVTVTPSSTLGFVPAETVFITSTANGQAVGYYQVSTVGPGLALTLVRLAHSGTSTSTGVSVPGNTCLLTKGGRPGADGANGADGATLPVTAIVSVAFTQPAANNGVVANVSDTRFMTAGMILVINSVNFYRVVSVNAINSVSLLNLGYTGSVSAGVTVPQNAPIGIAGIQGNTGATGATGAPGQPGIQGPAGSSTVTQLWAGTGAGFKPLATLPAPSSGTYDALQIEGVIGDWQWVGKSGIRIEMSNRGGSLGWRWWDYGGSNTAVSIRAYRQGDGSVNVWSYSTNGVSNTVLAVNIGGATLAANPDAFQSATPSGTLVFDTLNPGTYPPVNMLSTAVRGRTDATRSGYLTTMNQDLPSGFYSIYAADATAATNMGLPQAGWYYVLVNHHENNSSSSGFWRADHIFQLGGTNRRWFREVTNNSGAVQYNSWLKDYLPPYAMSQATFNASNVWCVYLNKTSNELEYSSLGALKGLLALATSQIPNQGGTPT